MHMQKSELTNFLFEALSKAQGEFKSPHKDKTAKVRMKSGGEYEYRYSDLATVIETNRAVMAKYFLCVTQTIETSDQGAAYLVTTLGHASGQWKSSAYPLNTQMGIQELGAQLTYLRRYQYVAIQGLASDDDTDAAQIETTTPKNTLKKSQEAAKRSVTVQVDAPLVKPVARPTSNPNALESKSAQDNPRSNDAVAELPNFNDLPNF